MSGSKKKGVLKSMLIQDQFPDKLPNSKNAADRHVSKMNEIQKKQLCLYIEMISCSNNIFRIHLAIEIYGNSLGIFQ